MRSRNLLIYLSALSFLQSDPAYALRHGSSRLTDVLAFPKYQVQFLNDLPLSTTDAHLCEDVGLEREDEFLGLRVAVSDHRRIGDGGEGTGAGEEALGERLMVVPMSLVPPGSQRPNEYLCLLPSANTTAAQFSIVQGHKAEQEEPDPVQSWQALSHLDGSCLYSRQGWFTYSYCHNSHVRQFRAAGHEHPHPPGGYIPTEDDAFDAYTLGQAAGPSKRKQALPPGRATPGGAGADAASGSGSSAGSGSTPPVSFGIGASSRYLVQRWSDGTPCDKTGRPREIEVQFHCGLTTTDMIYSVKELAICQYVMIVHTPHLCSLAGFRSEIQEVEPAPIRCRQVLSDAAFEGWVGAAGAVGAGLGLEMGKEFRPRGLEQKTSQESKGRVVVPDHLSQGHGHVHVLDHGLGFGLDRGFDVDVGLAGEGQDAALQEMLAKALEAISAQRRAHAKDGDTAHGGEGGSAEDQNAEDEAKVVEEMVLLWADDGEDGAILVEADLVLGDGVDGHQRLAEDERAMIMDAVRRFIGQAEADRSGSRAEVVDKGIQQDNQGRQDNEGQPDNEGVQNGAERQVRDEL